MTRVLALVPHSPAVASVRFRVAQYVEPLAHRGIALELTSFFTQEESASVWSSRVVAATAATLRGYRRRSRDLGRLQDYDAAIVHREIAPYVNGVLVRRLTAGGVPYLYDFDDAIYLPAIGGRRVTRVLRNAREETIALCHKAASVLAGNRFLARFCESHGAAAVVLPTVVETAVFQPAPSPPSRPAIVWVGSHSTERYIDAITEPLRRVCALTRARVKVVSQSARSRMGALDVEGAVWRLEDDARYFREATVGIYPLPDDEWSRGKCGLKALLFLASGVPVVASPVGVLQDMVIPGETGFLACTPEEWEQHVSTLLTNERLRREMGARGRALVEERYSLEVGAEILAREIERVKRQRVTPRRPRANGMA
ncbi:MAG: glycosyltransferase family 4 protein [Gemmatimonadetes bacterium]|nr:glycosyltransferase family 4 protein [Gemmatimonadota bacterium]